MCVSCGSRSPESFDGVACWGLSCGSLLQKSLSMEPLAGASCWSFSMKSLIGVHGSFAGVCRILLRRSSALFSAFACPSLEFRFLFYCRSLLINPKLIHIFQFLELVCLQTFLLDCLSIGSLRNTLSCSNKMHFRFSPSNELLRMDGSQKRSKESLLINLAIAKSDD